MNNLWRGIVCIKYRGALKRHARASGAQRAITLRSRNARKCARGSIRLVREVSWNTKLCARYEIRRSDTKIQFFFFLSPLLIFKKLRVCTWQRLITRNYSTWKNTFHDDYSWILNEWKSDIFLFLESKGQGHVYTWSV